MLFGLNRVPSSIKNRKKFVKDLVAVIYLVSLDDNQLFEDRHNLLTEVLETTALKNVFKIDELSQESI